MQGKRTWLRRWGWMACLAVLASLIPAGGAFGCCPPPTPLVITSPSNPCPGDLITITTYTYYIISCDPYSYGTTVTYEIRIAGPEYASLNCVPPDPDPDDPVCTWNF